MYIVSYVYAGIEHVRDAHSPGCWEPIVITDCLPPAHLANSWGDFECEHFESQAAWDCMILEELLEWLSISQYCMWYQLSLDIIYACVHIMYILGISLLVPVGKDPGLCSLLLQYFRVTVGLKPDTRITTIQVTRNLQTRPHCDASGQEELLDTVHSMHVYLCIVRSQYV